MPRHQYQLGPSRFLLRLRADGWFVVETYSTDDGHRGRDEHEEVYGPFDEAEARKVIAKGRLDRGNRWERKGYRR